MSMPMPPRGGSPRTSNRGWLYLGIAAAAIGGYYLYSARGDADRASRQAQYDARRLREKTLDRVEVIGDQVDRGVDDVRSAAYKKYDDKKADIKNEVEHADEAARGAKKKLENVVDRFDAKAEHAADKARETINKTLGR